MSRSDDRNGGATAVCAPPPLAARPSRARPIRAARAGRPEQVSYRTADTPLGCLLLAASRQGLVRVAFADDGPDAVLAALAAQIGPPWAAPARLDTAVRQLDDYLSGRRTAFALPLDLRLAPGFRRAVLGRLSAIGYGRTASYAEVAAAVGRPRAVRAVGQACATNPLPIVVPCHRVVRSDGALGGYAGGLKLKRALLELEAGRT